MLGRLWNRLTNRAEREAEREAPESPAERRYAHEGFEDHQGDLVVEERLGGVDPGRLLGDDGPPRGGGGV